MGKVDSFSWSYCTLEQIHLSYNTLFSTDSVFLINIYLLFDPLIVLQEPLQSCPVGMKLRLDIRGRQEPPLAAVQGLSEPGPAEENDEASDIQDDLITNP